MIEHPKGPHVLLTLALPVMAMDDAQPIADFFPPGKWVTVGPDDDVFGAMVLSAVADGDPDVRREAWADLVTPPVRLVAEDQP